MKREILLLGDPRLYTKSRPVEPGEEMSGLQSDLHDTLMAYRAKWGAGRAIAAPQIGDFRRVLYMCIDRPTLFVNPVLSFPDGETMELLDDCMSFPGLLVKVRRYKRCAISYIDVEWRPAVMKLEGDLSELIQHEYDHLDGILATMRAVDDRSLYYKLPQSEM